jgi:hypothetical protein
MRGRTAYGQAFKLLPFRKLVPPNPNLPIQGSFRAILTTQMRIHRLHPSVKRGHALHDKCLPPLPSQLPLSRSSTKTPKHTRAIAAGSLPLHRFEDSDVDSGGIIVSEGNACVRGASLAGVRGVSQGGRGEDAYD